VALGAGAAIGFERSYHGVRRFPHARAGLHCSSLLMLVTCTKVTDARASALVQLDPTRMAQAS